jgi:hypothetical protein
MALLAIELLFDNSTRSAGLRPPFGSARRSAVRRNRRTLPNHLSTGGGSAQWSSTDSPKAVAQRLVAGQSCRVTSTFEQELRAAYMPRSLAELEAAGITRHMTRGPAWRRTSRGFFVPTDVKLTTTQRILEARPLLPAGGTLAGWAAAYVLGADWLDGREPWSMHPLPLTVNLGGDLGRADTTGVHYVREQLPTEDRLLTHGIPVTSPERTAFDGARWATDVVEAVVFLDHIARTLDVDLTRVWARCAPPSSWAGVVQARRAVALADPASASSWESRLRMFYLEPAGLPRPLVNRAIFAPDGRLLGVADLFDPEAGLVTEFDGQEHRRRRQHRADNLREEELEAANLVVCRVDSVDLRFRASLADRLRARYAQGLRRDRRRDRWTLQHPDWRRRRAP